MTEPGEGEGAQTPDDNARLRDGALALSLVSLAQLNDLKQLIDGRSQPVNYANLLAEIAKPRNFGLRRFRGRRGRGRFSARDGWARLDRRKTAPFAGLWAWLTLNSPPNTSRCTDCNAPGSELPSRASCTFRSRRFATSRATTSGFSSNRSDVSGRRDTSVSNRQRPATPPIWSRVCRANRPRVRATVERDPHVSCPRSTARR